MDVGSGFAVGHRGGGAIGLQTHIGGDIDHSAFGMHGEGHNLVGRQRAVGGGEMVELLQPVGGDEVEAVVGGAHPFAVGAIDGDAVDAFVGHEVFVDAVLVVEDVAAVDRRGFAVAAVEEGAVAVVDDLDAFVGAEPDVARAVLHQAVDIVGFQLAAVVGVDDGLFADTVVHIDAVAFADEPLVACDAVPDQLVNLALVGSQTLQQGADVERLPGAVAIADSEPTVDERAGYPQVALIIVCQTRDAEMHKIVVGIRDEGTVAVVLVVDGFQHIVVDVEHAIAPRGGADVAAVLGVNGHVEHILELGGHLSPTDLRPLVVFENGEASGQEGALVGGFLAAGTDIDLAVGGGDAIDIVVGDGAVGSIAVGIVVGLRQPEQTAPGVTQPEGAVGVDVGVGDYQSVIGQRRYHPCGAVILVVEFYPILPVDDDIAVVAAEGAHFACAPRAPGSGSPLVEEGHAVGIVGAGGGNKAAAGCFEHAHGHSPHGGNGVERPSLVDMQTRAIARRKEETAVGSRPDKAVGESDIVNQTALAVLADVVGLGNLVAVNVEHHDAEACGEIGSAAAEADAVDFLVAADAAIADVGHMEDVAIHHQIHTGIIVGHNQAAEFVAVGHRADTHRRERHGRCGVQLPVVVEERHAGGGIDSVGCCADLAHRDIGVVVLPLADCRLCGNGSPQGQQHE